MVGCTHPAWSEARIARLEYGRPHTAYQLKIQSQGQEKYVRLHVFSGL
jgi:hypothetical protein